MRACFEERDLGKLQGLLPNFDPDTVRYHMKRCVDSGLWVPAAGTETAYEKQPEGVAEPEEEEEFDEPEPAPTQSTSDTSASTSTTCTQP